jgi:hypothetical protein
VPGLYGVYVAGHDPQLDHIARFDVIGVYGCDAEKVCGFVENVHMGFGGVARFRERIRSCE